MVTNAVVRSRISAEVKDKATAVLEEMGLTVSDVMRIVLTRVANENALPFDLKPNKLTRETMRKTAKGVEVHKAKDAADLFNKLESSSKSRTASVLKGHGFSRAAKRPK
jgi:DNA-damage-inducible protein J